MPGILELERKTYMSLYPNFCFDFILSFVEFTMVLYMLATALLNKRYPIRFIIILSFFAFIIAYVSSTLTAENIFIKSVLTISIYFVWVLICFKTDMFRALFVSVFWMSYLLLFDNISISVFTAIFGVGLDEIIQDFYAYYVLCMAAKSIEILGIVFLRIRIRKHVNKLSPLHLLSNISILILPLTSVVISLYFAKVCISIPTFTREFLICSIIILFVNIISIFLLEYIDKQNKALKNNEILRQNLKSGLENIEAWKEAYSGQRKLTHDFLIRLQL